MPQNTTHAVMSQRSEPRGSLDFFPTPPWATRALCERLTQIDYLRPTDTVWEPTCGAGHMARAIAEYAVVERASDIVDRGHDGMIIEDFLAVAPPPGRQWRPDWVITNPPFNLAEEFITRALAVATQGVAIMVRTQFLEGVGRYKRLFSTSPPELVLQYVERVPINSGHVRRKNTTATSYCWLVWTPGYRSQHTDLRWIPPCRKRLERDEDYTD